MNKMLLTVLMAATAIPSVALPTAASAQSRGEVRESQRDLREERRELRDAYRYGDRRDIREERRDVARAEREYSRDLRDYRRSHPRVYARGNWRAPFRHRDWQRGAYIDRSYYARPYMIADPWRYRLPRPSSHQRWIRHYDDVLLVNTRSGRVIDVYYNFFF